jgi:hypothetical protein
MDGRAERRSEIGRRSEAESQVKEEKGEEDVLMEGGQLHGAGGIVSEWGTTWKGEKSGGESGPSLIYARAPSPRHLRARPLFVFLPLSRRRPFNNPARAWSIC